MNTVSLVGRLTRDPEVRYSQGDNPLAIASYCVAVDRKYKKDGDQTADFINCKSFGKAGEFVEKYFHKGMRIGITGHIQTGNYTNKDGVKVYTTDVITDNVEFVESKSTISASNSGTPASNGGDDDFMNIPEGVEDGSLFN